MIANKVAKWADAGDEETTRLSDDYKNRAVRAAELEAAERTRYEEGKAAADAEAAEAAAKEAALEARIAALEAAQ